jgi:hypothetical protein
MTPKERQQTQADSLLVTQKPGGGACIPAVDSFDNITTKPRQVARIEPVTNSLSEERILKSIEEFVGDRA